MQPITVLKSGLWHLDIGKMPIPEPTKKEVTLGIVSEIYARFRKLSQKSYLFSFARDVRRIEERIGDRLG